MASGDTFTAISVSLMLDATDGGTGLASNPTISDVIAYKMSPVTESPITQELGYAARIIPGRLEPIEDTFSIASLNAELWRIRTRGYGEQTLTFNGYVFGARGDSGTTFTDRHRPAKVVATGTLRLIDVSEWSSGGIVQLDCTMDVYRRVFTVGQFTGDAGVEVADFKTAGKFITIEEVDLNTQVWKYQGFDFLRAKRRALGLTT